MIGIRELRWMNDSMILYLTKLGKSTKRNEIIQHILKDDACFFKMKQADAYVVLTDIGIGEQQLSSVYRSLISNDAYRKLKDLGILKEAEQDLKVTYQSYHSEDLFKNKNKRIEPQEKKEVSLREVQKSRWLQRLWEKIREIAKKDRPYWQNKKKF